VKRRGWIRERILRILLNEPDGTLTMYKVAKEAGCSFSWVHEFLGKLEVIMLVEGTRVRNYEGLVRDWQKVSEGL